MNKCPRCGKFLADFEFHSVFGCVIYLKARVHRLEVAIDREEEIRKSVMKNIYKSLAIINKR